MPDIFYLVSRWWKQLLIVVLLSLITAAAISFLAPKKYLSVSTALPASSYTADKARIFNENIQALYSVLGTTDELDMITGTGKLDTLYLAVTDEFNLYDHYKVTEKGEAARNKAALLLKKHTKVMKSEYGELKVKVWDKSKELAPKLANALMSNIQSIHQDLQNESNRATLQSLENGRAELQKQADSINLFLASATMTPETAASFTRRQTILSQQILKYETLIAEYHLMVNSKPPVLLIVEKARPSALPDNPTLLTVLLAAGFLGLLFALLLALVLEKRKTSIP